MSANLFFKQKIDFKIALQMNMPIAYFFLRTLPSLSEV